MKARIPSNNLDLTPERVAIIQEALKAFIDAENIEGVTPNRKESQDRLAMATLKKVETRDVNRAKFNAEEARIICACLYYLRVSIEESGAEHCDDDKLQKKTKHYLSIIDFMTSFFESGFKSAGLL